MKCVLFTIIEILIFSVFRGMGDSLTISTLFVLIHVIFMIPYIMQQGKSFSTYLCVGYLLRVAWLLIDYNDVFPAISGWFVAMDDEVMQSRVTKMLLTENLQYKYTNYSYFVYFLYELIGNLRLVAQYINVVIGVGIILVSQQLLNILELEITPKIKKCLLLFLTFYPYYIVYSGMLVRECCVTFFLILSLLYFIKWFQAGQVSNVVYCIMSVLIAAYMHDGAIFVLTGYMLGFIAYDRRQRRVDLNLTTVIRLVMITSVMIVLLAFYLSNFSNKMSVMKEADAAEVVAKQMSRTGGGSAYLTWLTIDSPLQIILYAPLKMVYFCLAPLPFDWRGINDIVGFIASSLILFYLLYVICKNMQFKKSDGGWNDMLKFLCISLFSLFLIFGIGTWTAGTAFRHRCKIFPIALVAFSIAKSRKKTNVYKDEE